MDAEAPFKKVFSYEEAVALMPQVREITERAYRQVAALGAVLTPRGMEPAQAREEMDEIIRDWAVALIELGLEIKGLWLVDFDNGAGYYCWQYPEPGLHYHSYEDGFRGRVPIH